MSCNRSPSIEYSRSGCKSVGMSADDDSSTQEVESRAEDQAAGGGEVTLTRAKLESLVESAVGKALASSRTPADSRAASGEWGDMQVVSGGI